MSEESEPEPGIGRYTDEEEFAQELARAARAARESREFMKDYELVGGKMVPARALQFSSRPLYLQIVNIVEDRLANGDKGTDFRHALGSLISMLNEDEIVTVEVRVRREPMFTEIAREHGSLPEDTY